MKIIMVLMMAIALAFVLGVRMHPENISDLPLLVTLREKDNLLIRWGVVPAKSKSRVPGSVGSVWGTKPRASAAPAAAQPSADQAGKKAAELARKATYASQF